MKKTLLVTTMLAAVATAQAGPLDSLMYSVRGLANTAQQIASPAVPAVAPAMPTATTVAASDLPPGVQEILTQLAASDQSINRNIPSSNCQSPILTTTPVNQARARFERREWVLAATSAKLASGSYAICHLLGAPAATNDLEIIGRLLAMSAIASKNGGIVTDQTVWEAQSALTLLRLSPASTQEQIAQIEAAEIIPVKVDASGQAAKADMGSLIEKYKTNTFGFYRQFGGKNIAFAGYVLAISGAQKSAVVTLAPNKQLKANAVLADEVACEIVDPESLDAIGNAAKGDKIEVHGVVQEIKYVPKIVLKDCRVKP